MFNYTLLPLANLSDVSILRRPVSTIVDADGASIHTYPFTSLPTLISHVHPTFVIFRLTLLLRSSRPFILGLIKANPSVGKVRELGSTWTAWFHGPVMQLDPSFVHHRDDSLVRTNHSSGAASAVTNPRRVPYPPSECTSPPQKWRRYLDPRGREKWIEDFYTPEEGECWVYSEPQSEEEGLLEQVIRGDVSEGSWTKETISEWAMACGASLLPHEPATTDLEVSKSCSIALTPSIRPRKTRMHGGGYWLEYGDDVLDSDSEEEDV